MNFSTYSAIITVSNPNVYSQLYIDKYIKHVHDVCGVVM